MFNAYFIEKAGKVTAKNVKLICVAHELKLHDWLAKKAYQKVSYV